MYHPDHSSAAMSQSASSYFPRGLSSQPPPVQLYLSDEDASSNDGIENKEEEVVVLCRPTALSKFFFVTPSTKVKEAFLSIQVISLILTRSENICILEYLESDKKLLQVVGFRRAGHIQFRQET